MSIMVKGENGREKKQFLVSILLALIAVVSISAATVAWFTIADYTKVYSMNMDITAGTNLRFDLDSHDTFEEYVKILHFSQIADRIQKDLGFDMRQVPLEPVTTSDVQLFTFEDGTTAEKSSGAYLEFTLHFIATDDMLLHLTSQDSSGGNDGTSVESSNHSLPEAMRISFTVDKNTYIYDPGMGNDSRIEEKTKWFGLPESEMVLNDHNQLFELKKDIDCPVTVRVWLEGTDASCTNDIRNADYSIRLRFVGTDEEYNILTGDGH